MTDLKLLGAALLFACLPWSGSALTTLALAILALQVGLLVMVLCGVRPIEVCQWALDACLLGAVIFTRSSWGQLELESNWLLLVPALSLQLVFLKLMLHHTKAHRQMQCESEERLETRLTNIESDLKSRWIDSEKAQQKRQDVLIDHQEANQIFKLGSQTAGLALLQTACLVFSRPSGSWWLLWCLTISLATFLNSKAQDLMLKHYLPEDSRLC
ncbi:hypothetical protein JST97_01495 [bacterium]|nr:hypothetical protein [bacterium]